MKISLKEMLKMSSNVNTVVADVQAGIKKVLELSTPRFEKQKAYDLDKHGRHVRNYLKDKMVPAGKHNYVGPYNILELLGDAKFKFLGNGYFGYVYEHIKTGLVVKIVGFAHGLDSYLPYARMCMQNMNSRTPLKHLPNIRYIEEGQDCYFVVMDKCVSSYIHYSHRLIMADVMRGEEDEDNVLSEDLRKTCEAIAVLANYSYVDLGEDNVMKQNGKLVITDPFSFVKTDQENNTDNNTTGDKL